VIWDHASRGSGPGELELPIAAEITSEGIWVADIFNGVFLLDRKSKREIRRLRNGSNAIQGLSALNDSTLILVGRGPVEKGRSSWIHALDARTGKTLWNALSITESALPPRSVRAFGFASAHNSGGNVVASFSLVDTVYIFDDKGRERVKVHAPLVDITGLSQIGSERPVRKVMDKVVRIIGAFSVGDSVVVVSTQRGSARNPQYGMARIYKSEPLRFEHVQNTPLMIGQTAGQLIGAFVDPIRPNRLVLLTDKSSPQ
jgi:outer membrane protein assembly factor BamB